MIKNFRTISTVALCLGTVIVVGCGAKNDSAATTTVDAPNSNDSSSGADASTSTFPGGVWSGQDELSSSINFRSEGGNFSFKTTYDFGFFSYTSTKETWKPEGDKVALWKEYGGNGTKTITFIPRDEGAKMEVKVEARAPQGTKYQNYTLTREFSLP